MAEEVRRLVDGVGGGIDYNMRRETARIWLLVHI